MGVEEAEDNAQYLKSPMPGLIQSVAVKPGDKVHSSTSSFVVRFDLLVFIFVCFVLFCFVCFVCCVCWFQVVVGQEMIVMEAMKMQNMLHSERDAVVKKVRVSQGDSVVVNAVLVEFEEEWGEGSFVVVSLCVCNGIWVTNQQTDCFRHIDSKAQTKRMTRKRNRFTKTHNTSWTGSAWGHGSLPQKRWKIEKENSHNFVVSRFEILHFSLWDGVGNWFELGLRMGLDKKIPKTVKPNKSATCGICSLCCTFNQGARVALPKYNPSSTFVLLCVVKNPCLSDNDISDQHVLFFCFFWFWNVGKWVGAQRFFFLLESTFLVVVRAALLANLPPTLLFLLLVAVGGGRSPGLAPITLFCFCPINSATWQTTTRPDEKRNAENQTQSHMQPKQWILTIWKFLIDDFAPIKTKLIANPKRFMRVKTTRISFALAHRIKTKLVQHFMNLMRGRTFHTFVLWNFSLLRLSVCCQCMQGR